MKTLPMLCLMLLAIALGPSQTDGQTNDEGLALTTSLAVKDAGKSNLRVLYVGSNPDQPIRVPSYKAGAAATRYSELRQERMPAFNKLLNSHFDSVKSVNVEDYRVEMSNNVDVTIFDAKPPAIEDVDMGTWTKHVRMPRDFNRPALMIGNVGPTTLGRHGLGFRLDHL